MTADRRAMANLDDAALAAALVDLGRAVAIPPTPDFATVVAARLRAENAADRTGRRRPWRMTDGRTLGSPDRRGFRLRWALVAALLALLLLAAIAAATGFGLPGLRILFGGPTASPSTTAVPTSAAVAPTPVLPAQSSSVGPSVPPSAPAASQAPSAAPPSPAVTLPVHDFGSATTLAAARAAVTFRVFAPAAATVANVEPATYLDPAVPDGQVVLIYPETPGLPGSSTSPVGPSGQRTAVLITESRGRVEEGFLQKMLGPNARISPVDVGGSRGFWITGEKHELVVVDARGEPRSDTLRQVGDVLVFVREGTLIRIESGLGLDRTLAIATALA